MEHRASRYKKNKPPFYKKWWFWLIVIIFIAAGIDNLIHPVKSSEKNNSDTVKTEKVAETTKKSKSSDKQKAFANKKAVKSEQANNSNKQQNSDEKNNGMTDNQMRKALAKSFGMKDAESVQKMVGTMYASKYIEGQGMTFVWKTQYGTLFRVDNRDTNITTVYLYDDNIGKVSQVLYQGETILQKKTAPPIVYGSK